MWWFLYIGIQCHYLWQGFLVTQVLLSSVYRVLYMRNKHYNEVKGWVCKCINSNHYTWVFFWDGWYRSFRIQWDSVIEIQTLSFKVLFFCNLFLMWVWFIPLASYAIVTKCFNPIWCIWKKNCIKLEYVFFLILHVLLWLRSVKCEMPGVSFLMVDSLLLIQMFGIPKYWCFHLWMCY